ncbi:MAG: gliding motility-associated C-terminal domain-containing protein [Saprospiraceae bacterium]
MIKNFNFGLTRTLFVILILSGALNLYGQPANDDPCNAIALDINTSCISTSNTNVLATPTIGVTAPGCANYLGGDVWFSFTMPNNGFHGLIEMGAAGISDGGMAVYSGTCGSLTLISCDDNGGTGSMPSITVDDGCSFELAGATIWVRVWENGNDDFGTFDICVQAVNPPVPSTATGCGVYGPASNTCCDAVILNESLNGFCGNTGGYTDNPDEIPGFCAFTDNNSWIAFVATETSVAFDFTSYNCTGMKGIQVDLFETSDCTNFNSISDGCFNIGAEGTGTLSASGLTVGEVYYIMVDGWAGDICDYSISVIGIDPVEVTVSDDEICQGESVQLQASVIGVGPYTYSWSPAGSLDDATIPNPVATPATTTTYTLTMTGGNLSTNTFTIPVTVFPASPTMPSIGGAATICENATGITYTSSAPNATEYIWSVTGGGTIVGSNTEATVSIDWASTGGDVCLIASNGCGASPQNCYPVSVGTEPDISATDPAAVCAPNSIDLATDVTVTDANNVVGTFSYFTDETAAEAGTPALPSSVVNISGTYWIRKESGGNCYDVTSVNITIEDPNLLVDDSALTTCEPGSLNLAFASVTETNGLFGTKTFYGTEASALAGTGQLSSTTVTVGGTYWVRFQTSNGCFAVAPINANIETRPDITITTPAPVCPGGTIDLTSVGYTDANMTTIVNTYFFTSQALADLGIPGFAMTTTDVGVGCYYIRVETANGCFDTGEICITEGTPPTADFSGGATICSGESTDLTFSLTGNGPFDVVYFDGTSNVTLTGIANGHTETISLTANTDFSLISVDDANCPGTVSNTVVSIVVASAPTATISGTTDLCAGSTTDLTINFAGGTGPYSIELFDGTTTTTLTGLNDGDTETVTPTANTTYTITSVTDANTCTGTGAGSAIINIVDTPTITNITEDCDLTTATYTISFDIINGDAATYLVSPMTGTLTGNTFVSDPIASGVGYNFDVSDANTCGTDNVNGTVNCACSVSAGTMDLTLIAHCENELGIAIHNGDEQLNTGDLLQYIIHDSSGTTLGEIFNTANVPEFAIELGTMSIGTTYYISAIAGPDDGTGMVDLMHPCLNVSAGTPVIFHNLPEATISGDATICAGTPTDLLINFTQGTGPFDIVIFDGTNATTLEDINDGYLHTVMPTVNTVYTITSVLDNTTASCIGSATGTATIDILTAPIAPTLDFQCNATNTAYQVSFVITGGDPGSYTVTGGAGTIDNATNTFTSDFIGTGVGFNFTLTDNNNCAPAIISGNFACDCTTFAGAMSSTPIAVCEDQLINGLHDGNASLDGDDALGFVIHDGSGNTLGEIFLSNSTPSFTYGGSLEYGTTYYLSAVVANDDGTGFPVLDSNLDPCISVTPGQPIVFEAIPVIALVGNATICEGDSTDITFNISGTGPFNLEYTDNVNNYILTDISDGHTLKLSPLTSTTYTVLSVANAFGENCMGTVDPTDFEATIDVISVPKVTNLMVDCNVAGTAFTVSFDIEDGNPAAYVVDGDAGTLTGSSFVSNEYPTGSTYSFMVFDGTGCDTTFLTSTEYCNCTPDIKPNITIAELISCNGENDGTLTVSNVNGQAPFEFLWSNGANGTVNNNLTTAWYYVTMTDGNNCTSVDSIFLSEPAALSASLEAQGVSCYGDEDGSILITNVNGGIGGYSYTLDNTSNTNNGFFGLAGGTYTAGVIDAAGCQWEEIIEVAEPSELTVELGETINLQLGDSVQLQAFVNQIVDTFYWETIGTLSCTDCLTPFVKPISSTPYKITVVTEKGCVDTDQVWVNLNKERPVFIPTAFSPNGDGSNDLFMIYGGVGIVEVKNLSIFNRWGDRVYQAENFQPGDDRYGWNGVVNNKKMNTGVYVYYLEIVFEDGKTELFRGDVTLMR